VEDAAHYAFWTPAAKVKGLFTGMTWPNNARRRPRTFSEKNLAFDFLTRRRWVGRDRHLGPLLLGLGPVGNFQKGLILEMDARPYISEYPATRATSSICFSDGLLKSTAQ
jgi:hypothetical protein